MHRRAVVAWMVVVASALVLAALTHPPARPAGPVRPNFIVLMTDDQTYDDLAVMPLTRRLLGLQGASFEHAYVSYPLCCPSRATFLTGEYAHNHRVFDNQPPTGGVGRLDATRTVSVWLQQTGYATIHIGKYLNGYGTVVPATVPPGWTDWRGAIDPTTYRMWGYTLLENGAPQTYGTFRDENPALYQTDVYRDKAIEAIRADAAIGRPFFLSVAFLAPHAEQRAVDGLEVRPAPRDRGRIYRRVLRFPPSFDERDVSDKPSFFTLLPRLSPAQRLRIDRDIHARQASLLAVDDAVAAIVRALRATRQLDHTYVLFTSDNGYLEGEHRIRGGKFFPYDASAHVPLLLRGPGTPAGARPRELVSNVDLAPTVVDATGARPTVPQDGLSLLPFARHPARHSARAILHEGLQSSPDGDIDRDGTGLRGVPLGLFGYDGVRTSRYLWIQHGSGERELYDLRRDPFELHSRVTDPAYRGVRRALRRILSILRACRGRSCRQARPLSRYGARAPAGVAARASPR